MREVAGSPRDNLKLSHDSLWIKTACRCLAKNEPEKQHGACDYQGEENEPWWQGHYTG